ncbi:MAG: Preprotein translocase subunit SecF [Candidatus Midichloria mitochondrii]|uniref:Protein-export membrane protein SecF n=1 Tax=Midichloria mitochondrii (strain IricVA) TaxID=696127 RepID=F7XU26_MIDMI|nr:protein translocase subunit SecF [Candidatus Midichloria mitochondrii]AEI89385.1 preprotein translocase subunit SecF [Candidatus Midichloria mitochondrii IricVA]MDJ1255952.1 protein translocase subunit SecF [Candidatus Midichloria mitochondrii]MDJ1287690.1 protein translocase subunit SecF [Candidatus Midichloria mitochondrii]MDJ1298552.1 protein translocase subunit SecF [Candidatus Midichloria mitochondrii]MDJ1312690.1 protein translocase subunit SecF [Candidatus Midichloria mitochondrii]
MLKLPIILIKQNTKINFLKQRHIAYLISTVITIVTLICIFTKGFNLGIDFTGGVIMEISSSSLITATNMRSFLDQAGYHGAAIQYDEKDNLIVRLQTKNDNLYASEIEALKNSIATEFTNVEFRKIDYVGPKIGDELINKGIIAVVLALIAMMIYVAIRFNWVFGIGVVIALVHDIIAALGFYIFSRFEFNLTSIAAILTIIGYSVNDSVVIYDRIRENLKKHSKKSISELINLSINETLSRTIMTAATTLVVCIALVLFGGPALKGFGATLFFGTAFGTYSSIYISAPLLTLFYKSKEVKGL